MSNERILDISWGTIFKIFVAIFIFYFIYLTKEIVLWLFFALAVSVLLDPAINFLRKNQRLQFLFLNAQTPHSCPLPPALRPQLSAP